MEEEEKNSGGSQDGEKELQHTKRKNLLCKSLLQQTKELCYTNSAVYKDFDKMFDKIMNKFQYWELFDTDEVVMAGQALKIIANSS